MSVCDEEWARSDGASWLPRLGGVGRVGHDAILASGAEHRLLERGRVVADDFVAGLLLVGKSVDAGGLLFPVIVWAKNLSLRKQFLGALLFVAISNGQICDRFIPEPAPNERDRRVGRDRHELAVYAHGSPAGCKQH